MPTRTDTTTDTAPANDASKEPLVYQIIRDLTCTECGTELWKNSFLYLDAGQALCLACAGMGDLEFLPSGDTAMTRRSKKHSDRYAVVLRFSRSRNRYERQGILVTETAIQKAEDECSADAPERAQKRAHAAITREKEDVVLVDQWTAKIASLFPRCPPDEARKIAEHTAVRGSGRVGRSEAGRQLDDKAVTAAVIAAIRHLHTRYDRMLAKGAERVDARETVRPEIDRILDKWRGAA